MKKALIVAAFIVLPLSHIPATAQWHVIDIPETAQIIKVLRQAREQYMIAQQHYQMYKEWSHNLTSLDHYKWLVKDWIRTETSDTYGLNGAWVDAANSGGSGRLGPYVPLQSYPVTWINGLSGDGRSRALSRFANIELIDGANSTLLNQAGTVRSSNGSLETVGIDTNKILSAMAQQQQAVALQDRNERVSALDSVVAAGTTVETTRASVDGLGQAIMDSTLP